MSTGGVGSTKSPAMPTITTVSNNTIVKFKEGDPDNTIIVEFEGRTYEVMPEKKGSINKEGMEKIKISIEGLIKDKKFQKHLEEAAKNPNILCKAQTQTTGDERKCTIQFFDQNKDEKQPIGSYTHTWQKTAEGVSTVALGGPLKLNVVAKPTSPISSTTTSVNPTGLRNFGNTCWMNSSLQALNASGLMEELLKRAKSEQAWMESHRDYQFLLSKLSKEEIAKLPGNMPELLAKYKNSLLYAPLHSLELAYANYQDLKQKHAYEALEVIYEALKNPQHDEQGLLDALENLSNIICKTQNWKIGRQQDAAEFLNLLMGSLNYTPTSIGSISKYVDPHTKIDVTQPHPEEPLDLFQLGFVHSKTDDLQKLFDQNCAFIKQDDTIKVKVGDKQVDSPYKKRYYLTSAPDVLTLQLKRFGYDPKKNKSYKINNAVGLKPDIDGNFRLNAAAAFNKGSISSAPYSVNNFVVHIGKQMEPGHYVNFYRKDNDWYCANDEEVRKISIEEAEKWLSEAYLIFLKKE